MPSPKLQAMLFKQGIEGDDALLRLAQRRLQEAGLGGELYPTTPEELTQQLPYRPAGLTCTAHLPRDINLLQPEGRDRILVYAAKAAGQLYGVLVHDHPQFGERLEGVSIAFRDLERRLSNMPGAPLLFVEYAAGHPPDLFASWFERTVELRHVCACVDVSHVGIQVCQTVFADLVPSVNLFGLRGSPELQRYFESVERATAEALPRVLALVKRLTRLGKPLHFHLHDGHPLSTLSRFGVSDHLSFLQEIRLPFTQRGRQLLGGMYGPAGLAKIVRTTLEGLAPELVSFMLEVHPQEGRTPLGPNAALFQHWKDVSNAERMNYWLDMLLQNAVLLRQACA